MAESKEIAIKESDVALYESNGSSWIAGLESDIMRTKFLKLLSYSSQTLIPGSESFIDGAKAGDYVISSTKEVFGQSIRVVVCGTKKEYIERDAAPPDGKYVASHSVEEFSRIKPVLKQDEKKPGNWYDSTGGCFVETMHLYLLNIDAPEAGGLCMSFTSSGIPVWREIISRTLGAKTKLPNGKIVNLHPSAIIWTLGNKVVKPDIGNPYLLPDIKGNFELVDPSMLSITRSLFDEVDAAIKASKITSDNE